MIRALLKAGIVERPGRRAGLPGRGRFCAVLLAAAAGILSSAASLGGGLGLSGAEQPFLPPDRAFAFTVEIADAHTLRAHWEVADGYYMYRDKIAFALPGASGVSLGAPELPAGKVKEDEFFGRMEVYYHQVDASLGILGERLEAVPVTLEVRYQGCADQGFCYPPITKKIALVLPAAAAGPRGDGTADGPLPEQDRIAAALASGGLLLNLASFFGFGLLLAFTPCVLPMIPILSSLIVGQGRRMSTRRAFFLSLSYVLAMAVTYTVAGVLAGLFGQNLQAVFQRPGVIVGFAAVFVLLALSMFGFYELQLPSRLQTRLTALSNRQAGGSYLGAGVMGFLSALIVGPCIAAPLAGALMYIGLSGDGLRGGLALFALSLGMGIPLLVIGTSAGRLLPKPGPWMNAVKGVFGVLLLGVAVWMLERLVPGPVALFLWAVLLIGSAVYMGAFDRAGPAMGGWRRLWKGCGLVFAVYGVVLIVGAAAGGGDVLRPLQGLRLAGESATPQSGAVRGLPFKRAKGLAGLDQELAAAAARHQSVMLDVYADWCVDCKIMERRTFSAADVRQVLSGVVLLQADVTANDAADQELLRHYGLYGPPAVLFFDASGDELRRYRLIGFLGPEQFSAHAKRALARDL